MASILIVDDSEYKPREGWLRRLFGVFESTHPAVVTDEMRRKCEEVAIEAAHEAYAFARLRAEAAKYTHRCEIPDWNSWLPQVFEVAKVRVSELESWMTRHGLSELPRPETRQIRALTLFVEQLGLPWKFARMIFARVLLKDYNCDPFAQTIAVAMPSAAGHPASEGYLPELEQHFESWIKRCPPHVRKELNAFLGSLDDAHRGLATYESGIEQE